MTKVVIYTKENSVIGFSSKDHAGYAEEGEDIFCSAISVLVTTAINSINEFTDDDMELKVDEDEASIEVHFKEKPSYEAELLINSMILGLESIVNYPDGERYLSIMYEEV